MTSLELLAPAKNLACGIAAIDHGADAVYIGASRFGARSAAGNSIDDIRQLCEYAHPFGASAIDTVIITRDLNISDWFNGCEINIVEFPQGLTSIGDYAFKYQNDSYNYYYRYSYSLKSITIPSSVTSIGSQAFYKCSYLTSVTCLATVPPRIVS